ncbi:hypothetical protein BN7_1936 [Wickerhamomyces ciferrii]|uniref:Uncharacterized protein n=1 Tax=Wickerhamomyces ciferrii (strain ATCC 14091 / BCRC 22168 / CBS 111 / JCM 3599 / NBRC 0793 / NRRL Y-1031 F-60-10) TaxID=1206466 RepID=K0KHB4_WICCF|nr:uncharacterized protein BN7_1936 [Wickerhamomyces ciferrii]CCH42391.1 hypothetical protein BN7_1936 [Wickerhamomyces ciferrii]
MSLPKYLNTKAEVISFCCAGTIINYMKDGKIPSTPMHIVSDENHHSITIHGLEETNSAIKIDDDRYIVDIYRTEFMKYNKVISFQQIFGNVCFPVPFEQVNASWISLLIPRHTLLQLTSFFFRIEIMGQLKLSLLKPWFGKIPQDPASVPPSMLPRIKLKEFLTQSIVKKSLKDQLKRLRVHHSSKFENSNDRKCENETEDTDFGNKVTFKKEFKTLHLDNIPKKGGNLSYFSYIEPSPRYPKLYYIFAGLILTNNFIYIVISGLFSICFEAVLKLQNSIFQKLSAKSKLDGESSLINKSIRAMRLTKLPLHLHNRLELAAFIICGALLSDFEEINVINKNVLLSYDSQSVTISLAGATSVTAVSLDDRCDKILLSNYFTAHVKFSDVIIFKDVFGDVKFPIKFSDAIVNRLTIGNVPLKCSSLQLKAIKYFEDFRLLEPGKTGMKHIIWHDNYPDNYATPKQYKDEQRKKFISKTSILNGFIKSAIMDGTIGKKEEDELSNSDCDEENIESRISSSPGLPNKQYIPVEYPDIPFGGQSSYLFGLKRQNPFTRTASNRY